VPRTRATQYAGSFVLSAINVYNKRRDGIGNAWMRVYRGDVTCLLLYIWFVMLMCFI